METFYGHYTALTPVIGEVISCSGDWFCCGVFIFISWVTIPVVFFPFCAHVSNVHYFYFLLLTTTLPRTKTTYGWLHAEKNDLSSAANFITAYEESQ